VSDAEIYPLTFEPALRHYIWGGRNLERLYGRKLPPGVTAESWEISGHPDSPTRVDRGYWRGKTLIELLDILGPKLVGPHTMILPSGERRFPLLIKLLDAERDLSVQVHPDDAYAIAHEHDLGKVEAWYVLHARPKSTLIYGLAPGVTREAFCKAARAGHIEPLLGKLAVRVGDLVYVPAGTLHALTAGMIVVEVQQNSDATYRVYDWGRLGADGKPRPLHIDKACKVIDFEQPAPGVCRPKALNAPPGIRRVALLRCPQFTIEQLDMATGSRFVGNCTGETFEIWGCISGRAHLTWEDETLPLEAVRFVLLPAMLGAFEIQSPKAVRLLRIYME